MRHAILALGLSLSACASLTHEPIPTGARYVAMGSSYAAGPGIPTYVDNPSAPCSRSNGNYAHQLAERRGLQLVDVSCSGGTTSHLLAPRGDIAPQLDALNAETKLVTITIGGNDVGYMTRLGAASCAGLAVETGVVGDCRAVPPPPTEQAYAELARRMDQIAKEVRKRSPHARLVFVDYLTVLPPRGGCKAAPLSAQEADIARELARRLAAITAKAASDNGGEVIRASALSQDHSACASDAWMNGYPRPGAPVMGTSYHPNLQGMTAIADALDALIWN